MSKTAILEYDGNKYEFPVIIGTEGEKAIDISKLRDLNIEMGQVELVTVKISKKEDLINPVDLSSFSIYPSIRISFATKSIFI